jgi:hypothetical protein
LSPEINESGLLRAIKQKARKLWATSANAEDEGLIFSG